MDFNDNNCKGIKSSYGVIDNFLQGSECDMIFVSEHWVTENEIASFRQRFTLNNRWMHMKSSINPEEILVGRPHGGIGFIAKRREDVVYRPIIIDSNRTAAVQLISNGQVILTVYGVYMPHFNGQSDQIELYSETLDILQSTIDNMELSPLMIVADMNAALPKVPEINRHWYRQHPYNKHSYILYDFLRNNELMVSNFNFHQDVSYSYFIINTRSYIDHVFTSARVNDMVTHCHIMHDLHHTTLQLSIDGSKVPDNVCGNNLPNYPRINWSDTRSCLRYKE